MNAENTPEQGTGTPPAGGQELSIPKHRFDEVAARLREAEDAIRIKDALYQQELQRIQRANQSPAASEPEISHEETGLDEQTHRAALKIADRVVGRRLADAEKKFNNVLGHLGNQLEASQFLVKHGADKEGYLDKIRSYQQRQMQTTGQYMDVETAYKLVRFDEQEAASRRAPAQAGTQAQPTAPAASPAAQQSYPNPAHTRGAPAASAPAAGGPKSFSEMSVEEMEARLDEQFRGGDRV